jgi:cob(I)alamin adenosyltransferase
MKIYTKTGDDGETGLFGGARVSKGSARVDAYGDVDELNSALGVALAQVGVDANVRQVLTHIQSELFTLGAELATVPGKEDKLGIAVLSESEVQWLEQCIDRFEVDLQPLKNFVLPGGCAEASFLHLARTICRRAERKVVCLQQSQAVRGELVRFLNRLSDLLFVLARHANFRANVSDVEWRARVSRNSA